MDALRQTGLQSLMSISSGHPDLVIGIIDGPVDFSHPAFQGSKIRTVKNSQLAACKNASDIACMHGTFVASILCSKRGLPAAAICPGCEVILNPIFKQEITDNRINNGSIVPSVTPEELSYTILERVDAGARIINLSLGLSTSSLIVYDKLQQAYDYTLEKGVIIVVAAGNQGNIGNTSLINHQWIIPVSACAENGRLDPLSNIGASIGSRGLMAPGVNIKGACPGGQYTHMSGTSFAAPFVTGGVALLWSIFPKATAAEIIQSLITSGSHIRRAIVPPLLDAEAAREHLKNSIN